MFIFATKTLENIIDTCPLDYIPNEGLRPLEWAYRKYTSLQQNLFDSLLSATCSDGSPSINTYTPSLSSELQRRSPSPLPSSKLDCQL